MDIRLHAHYEEQCAIYPHINLFTATVYDMLHTVLLGICSDVYQKSMECLQRIGNIDNQHYGNNVALLDTRVKNFPINHAVTPVQLYTFNNGVSKLLTASKTASSKNLSSLNSGRVEAQKFPALLFIVICCIGSNGDIVPNRRQWSIDNGLERPGRDMNPTDVILKALISCLDVVLNLKCRDPTVQQTQYMQEVMLVRS